MCTYLCLLLLLLVALLLVLEGDEHLLDGALEHVPRLVPQRGLMDEAGQTLFQESQENLNNYISLLRLCEFEFIRPKQLVFMSFSLASI